jgi:transketolase
MGAGIIMRNAFAAEITALAAIDDRIVLLSGDIGNRLFDDFKTKFPTRYVNCGVAEANMTSVAAGMALCGLRPFTYSITPFVTTRCLEQIRLDVCYQNVPVIIVGTGAGLSYASLNATHHSCEDIGFLRMLPNMSVICPGDSYEVKLALRAAVGNNGPTYIRLGKKGEPNVHGEPPTFAIGKGIVIREGGDVCLLGTGNMLSVAVAAAEVLSQRRISARVVSFHTVKPLDQALLLDAFTRFKVVSTVEEHSVLGGLGGSVAEWLADQASPRARLVRVGTPDSFTYEGGEQEFFRHKLGLTCKAIADRVEDAFLRSSSSMAKEV